MASKFVLILVTLLSALRPSPLSAAEVSLHAEASPSRAELGESIQYTLTLTLQGQTQFSPQLELPRDFPGFQVRQGPQQQQSMNWVNGAVTQSWAFTWELAPLKAGTLHLPVIKVHLKDPTGEKVKASEDVTVTVSRGRSFSIPPTPTAPAGPPATPEPVELRPLKADLGLPWLILGALVLALCLPLGFVLWLLLRKPKKKAAPLVRPDDASLALRALEACRPLLKAEVLEPFFLEVARILRDYLKPRLDLKTAEPTLFQLQQALDRPEWEGPLEDLALALFARKVFSPKEAEKILEDARSLIVTLDKEEKDERRKEAEPQR